MNFKGRDFLTLFDYTEEEILYLIKLAEKFKEMKKKEILHEYFKGKNIAILFEKTSTRTRCAFEVAAYDLGLGVTFIDPNSSQLGHKESIADTAQVLCRMYNGIEYRGFDQKLVEELAENSSVPVWNGLTDSDHPTQMLADFLTLKEHFGYIKGLHLSHYGDIRNNTSRALMIASAKLGVHICLCGPKELWPEQEFIDRVNEIAKVSGGSVKVTDDIDESVKDADVFYTDVWLSMGEDPNLWKERIDLLLPYQVNMDLINKGKDTAVVMHPLPSFHDDKTRVGAEIKEKYGVAEMEISDEAFKHERNVIFDQAENRMHTIKAVIYATLSNGNEFI